MKKLVTCLVLLAGLSCTKFSPKEPVYACKDITGNYGKSKATFALVSTDKKISHIVYDDYFKSGLIMVYHEDHHGSAGYGTVNFQGTFKFLVNGSTITKYYDNWELKRVNLNTEMMQLFRTGIILEYNGYKFDRKEAEKWRQSFVCLATGY